jgi:phosphatidylserine/phosphatidylglycerophosphate/cardiolipin synthase-like enzyme
LGLAEVSRSSIEIAGIFEIGETEFGPAPVRLPAGGYGVLHVKAVVVDGRTPLVTSANLTEAAFDRNIEVGHPLSGEQLAASFVRHFRVLIDQRLLTPMPQR